MAILTASLTAPVSLSAVAVGRKTVTVSVSATLSLSVSGIQTKTASTSTTLSIINTVSYLLVRPASTILCINTAVEVSQTSRRTGSISFTISTNASGFIANRNIQKNFNLAPRTIGMSNVREIEIVVDSGINATVSVPISEDSVSLDIETSVLVEVDRCQP